MKIKKLIYENISMNLCLPNTYDNEPFQNYNSERVFGFTAKGISNNFGAEKEYFIFASMNISSTITTFPATNFIGIYLEFSYANYRAYELWSNFMPRRNEIENTIGNDLYNVQINPDNFDFLPHTPFVKWACRPVSKTENIPANMHTLHIPEGLYAVFTYRGNTQNAANFFAKVYTNWLPNSGFELDNRPQFEILGTKYKNNDPNSEEEVYIPVKKV